MPTQMKRDAQLLHEADAHAIEVAFARHGCMDGRAQQARQYQPEKDEKSEIDQRSDQRVGLEKGQQVVLAALEGCSFGELYWPRPADARSGPKSFAAGRRPASSALRRT